MLIQVYWIELGRGLALLLNSFFTEAPPLHALGKIAEMQHTWKKMKFNKPALNTHTQSLL